MDFLGNQRKPVGGVIKWDPFLDKSNWMLKCMGEF